MQPEQLRDVLARLIEAGKGRTAGKLRSYLRAAFALASRARLDPAVPGAFAAFDVTTNPADRLPALAQFNGTRDRALTLPELRAFWRRLTALPAGAQRDAVVACVLLGGQRPAQLLRVSAADLDLSGGTLQLLDPKGRNRASKPRRHVVPIVADLLPILERRRHLCADSSSPLFSLSGKMPLTDRTCGELVIRLCNAMNEARELERGDFRLCDLRRTAETHLAALGVSSDVRAQIQSHGLHGVQIKHYDRHDYDREKRAALALWADRLYGRGSTQCGSSAAFARAQEVGIARDRDTRQRLNDVHEDGHEAGRAEERKILATPALGGEESGDSARLFARRHPRIPLSERPWISSASDRSTDNVGRAGATDRESCRRRKSIAS